MDLIDRTRAAFGRIKVKEPFSTRPELKILQPSSSHVAGTVQRLREVYTEEELTSMDDAALAKAVKRVWELVRWIHYDQGS